MKIPWLKIISAKNKLPPAFIVPCHEPWERPADFIRQTCLELAKSHPVWVILEPTGQFWLAAVISKLSQLIGLAKSSAPVLPTNSTQNLVFLQPLWLFPGNRWPLIHQLNQTIFLWWLKIKLNKFSVWLWIFEPNFWFYPQVISSWVNWRSLYDCVDDHSQTAPALTQQIKDQEQKLIYGVTAFVTNSQVLAQLHTPTRPPTAVVAQGFNLDLWPKRLKKLVAKTQSPIIFLAGALDDRVDWPLMSWLVKQLPQARFLLAGPVSSAAQSQLNQLWPKIPANVRFLGYLPRQKLTDWLVQAQVCLIPYRFQLPSVKHCFPMKVLEYFAFGKPVVASSISELKLYQPLVTLAKNQTDWLKALKLHLNSPWPLRLRRQQRQVAWQHRWSVKIDQILKLIL